MAASEWVKWFGTNTSNQVNVDSNAIQPYGNDLIIMYQSLVGSYRPTISRITADGTVLWTTILGEYYGSGVYLCIIDNRVIVNGSSYLTELNPATGEIIVALTAPNFGFGFGQWLGYVGGNFIFSGYNLYRYNSTPGFESVDSSFNSIPNSVVYLRPDLLGTSQYTAGTVGSQFILLAVSNVIPSINSLLSNGSVNWSLRKDGTGAIKQACLTPDGGFIFILNDVPLAIDGNSWRLLKVTTTGIQWTVRFTNTVALYSIAADQNYIVISGIFTDLAGTQFLGTICLNGVGSILWSRNFSNPGQISYFSGYEGMTINNSMGYYFGTSSGSGPLGNRDVFIYCFNLNGAIQSTTCTLFSPSTFVVSTIPEPTYASHFSNSASQVTLSRKDPASRIPTPVVAPTFSSLLVCASLAVNMTATYGCVNVDAIANVVFQAIASGGTAPYTYAWTFGDGSTGTGANPTHDYSGLGPYTVIVTVTDDVGSTASASLVVQCAGTIHTARQYFVDCPSFTREQALELPITDTATAYTSKNASIPFTENVLYTVYSRHQILSPVLGAVPSFADNWNPDASEKKHMYAWINPVSAATPTTVFILNFALRNATAKLPYLTNDNHGSFFLRILPDTPGEILGFKSAPYIDQTGSSLESPLDQTKINQTYIKLVNPTGTSTTQTNHVLASNPYATLGDPPLESFPGENPGDQILGTTAPKSWESGTDRLQWLDNKSVQWGVLNAVESRGLRFYITGCEYDTIMELMISDFQGDSDSRIKKMWLGSHRVCYFGLPGDKIRWYMTHRCGEPIPYTPIYGNGDSVTSEAQNSPLTCLVSAQDQPPTVTITSCPASGGGGGGITALTLGTPEFTTDCSPSNPNLTCASVLVTVSGGQAPLQVSCHVSIPGDPLDAGPTIYQTSDQVLSFLWDPILAGVSAPIVTTVTVTDSLGTTVTSVQTINSYTPITCPP